METHDYNSYAQDYANLGFSGSYYLAFRDISNLIKLYCKNKSLVLDYGCGTGRSTRFLKDIGFEKVFGVDISQSMIQEAAKDNSQNEYKLIKSGETGFDDSSFDLVFSSFVFLEIKSLDEITNVLKEMKRIVKKDGKIIFVTSILSDYRDEYVSFSYNFPENDKSLERMTNVRLTVKGKESSFPLYDYNWVDDEYRCCIESAGLKIVKLHNPIGTKDDPIEWISEDKKPYFYIYVLEK